MMKRRAKVTLVLGALAMGAASAAAAGSPTFPVRRYSPDAVVAGTMCLDTYEASVWRVPNPTTTNGTLVRKIAQSCEGDCNGDRSVPIDEIIGGGRIAFGDAPIGDCQATDGDGAVTVNDLVAAVGQALHGHGAQIGVF